MVVRPLVREERVLLFKEREEEIRRKITTKEERNTIIPVIIFVFLFFDIRRERIKKKPSANSRAKRDVRLSVLLIVYKKNGIDSAEIPFIEIFSTKFLLFFKSESAIRSEEEATTARLFV